MNNRYSEKKYFDFKKAVFVSKAGHFTQMLWKDVKEIGCARVMETSGDEDKTRMETFIVCMYKPPGNMKGEYGDNVLDAGKPTTDLEKALDVDDLPQAPKSRSLLPPKSKLIDQVYNLQFIALIYVFF